MELLNSALVHAGPVISLAFAANSEHLFTTSLDGTVFGLDLEGLQEGSEAQPPPAGATLEVRLAVGEGAIVVASLQISWRFGMFLAVSPLTDPSGNHNGNTRFAL